ncbi:MAG: hypothetical protein J5J00_10830 [Deltaproteobacteria bacterium]|nr:hypothetical protein [Deltaproteobacteria bacterium]
MRVFAAIAAALLIFWCGDANAQFISSEFSGTPTIVPPEETPALPPENSPTATPTPVPTDPVSPVFPVEPTIEPPPTSNTPVPPSISEEIAYYFLPTSSGSNRYETPVFTFKKGGRHNNGPNRRYFTFEFDPQDLHPLSPKGLSLSVCTDVKKAKSRKLGWKCSEKINHRDKRKVTVNLRKRPNETFADNTTIVVTTVGGPSYQTSYLGKFSDKRKIVVRFSPPKLPSVRILPKDVLNREIHVVSNDGGILKFPRNSLSKYPCVDVAYDHSFPNEMPVGLDAVDTDPTSGSMQTYPLLTYGVTSLALADCSNGKPITPEELPSLLPPEVATKPRDNNPIALWRIGPIKEWKSSKGPLDSSVPPNHLVWSPIEPTITPISSITPFPTPTPGGPSLVDITPTPQPTPDLSVVPNIQPGILNFDAKTDTISQALVIVEAPKSVDGVYIRITRFEIDQESGKPVRTGHMKYPVGSNCEDIPGITGVKGVPKGACVLRVTRLPPTGFIGLGLVDNGLNAAGMKKSIFVERGEKAQIKSSYLENIVVDEVVAVHANPLPFEEQGLDNPGPMIPPYTAMFEHEKTLIFRVKVERAASME